MSQKVLLSGNEAIARGAWEAGCRFGSGYPGTPSSEILPALTKLGGCYTEWSVNEKCALEAASGASLAGARSLVTMKHVGLNVAADPLFTQAYTGVVGGMVIVSASDPHMHSSQNEQDNRHYARAAKVPMLEPATPQEAYEFTKLAFKLSERFDTPILLLTTTRLSHSEGIVVVGERREPAESCAVVKDAAKHVMIPAQARQRRAAISERLAALSEAMPELGLNRIERGGRAMGIIAGGIPYQCAREVAGEASFLKLGVSWPLAEGIVREFAASVDRLYVIEELDPFIADSVRALGLTVEALPESLQRGELTPGRVRAALQGQDVTPAPPGELPARPPQLCPGCPHRGVFAALRRLKVFVAGDIGCYTLGTLPPLEALHTCLCMGAGIGQVHGLTQACGGRQKAVAVIGDSTFVHSGITGLVNLAYNNSPATVIILDNATTAMTGGQDHPGTGQTLAGHPGHRLDLAGICLAAGVAHVVTVNPHDLAATQEAIEIALALEAPAVVIAKSPCLLTVRERGTPRVIDEEQCVRCGACLRIGCPAISALPGPDGGPPQPAIDAVLCAGCTLCAQICPKEAILAVTAGGEA
jgi:indolepyruvate ferredoxin oxidoreductase alpha subunit